MTATTDVVRKSSFEDAYRRHGFFFREAAILTILIGFGHMAGYWFSYLLLCLVYPAFLFMLWKVRYRYDSCTGRHNYV